MTNGEKFVKTFPDLARVELYRKNERATRIEFDSVWWNAEYKEPTTKNDLDFKLKDYVSREAVRRIIKSPRTQEQMLNALNSLRNVTECNVEDCINRDYTAKYVEEFANNEYVSQDEAETIYLIADGIRHIPSVLPKTNDLVVDWDELKHKILMEVDGSTDDAWLAYGEVCNNISNSIDEYVQNIKAMTPVTPQEPRWIPVSERLPEIQNYSDNYLVTLKSDGVHIGMFTECNGKHWWTHYDDVVAWMPLPKPYEPQESEA